jgi:hypothetical protein
MSELDSIIQITITRETAEVATASFNIPLILASFTNFSERARVYASIDEVGGNFASTSNVYKMAQRAFSGTNGRVPQVVIGRRQVDSVVGTVPVATTGQVYTVTVNETNYSYTAVGGDTAAVIVAGLETAYNLAPKVGITFTDNTDGTFDIAPGVAGTAWSLVASSNIVLTNNAPTETWIDALEAVENVNSEWYALLADTHVLADQEDLAEYIEAKHNIYLTSTQDPVTPSTGTTDIGYSNFSKNYSRTSTTYHTKADTQFPEAAWAGQVLPYTVGSVSWGFKTVSGVDFDSLTTNQRTNLRAKHVNMYTRVGGQNIFQDGDMADQRPMSEIMISDWIYARLQERIFSRLVNLPKIPMSTQGIGIVENEIRGVLSDAVSNGGITSFTVTSPNINSIPFNDKVQGILGTFSFRAILAGEVRKVVIQGTLTY